MNVAVAMTPREELVTVSVPGTRGDALEYLQERRFSSVPVIKDENENEEVFRGLLSRDALIERPDEDQLAMLVEDVPTTSRETTIEEVAGLMIETGARRVPVVDGRLEGIVTITDVIRAIAEGEAAGDAEVGPLSTTSVNGVYAETPLTVAERELSYAESPYGVVLDDDGEMCGILTEVDVLDVARVVEGEDDTGGSMAEQDSEWLWEGIKTTGNRYLPTRNVELPTGPVREFMTGDVVTVRGDRTARETAQEMIDNDVEQIPLVDGDDLAGIVRDVDVLEALR